MVLLVHLIVTNIGFWFVETTVEMESLRNLLDSVDDCIVLVNDKTHGVVFVNKAAKELEIKIDGEISFSFEHGKERAA